MVLMLLAMLAVYGGTEVGGNQQSQAPSAAEMTWPEGVELLAAQALTLPSGEYQWQITTLTAPTQDAEPTDVHRGVLIAVNGAVLVEINQEDTIRLNSGAALILHENDSIVTTSAEDGEADFLMIELVTSEDAEPGETGSLVGPLEVPEGGFLMVLLNLPTDVNNDETAQQVIQGALRPGVSISHNGEGIPETVVSGEEYERWIVGLYPYADANGTVEGPEPGGTSAESPALVTPPIQARPPAATSTPTPTAVATPAATTTPTPTAAASPTATMTPTATDTPTATVTATATATATATVTPTATSTPTMIPPTPTPPPTPTMVPTVESTTEGT